MIPLDLEANQSICPRVFFTLVYITCIYTCKYVHVVDVQYIFTVSIQVKLLNWRLFYNKDNLCTLRMVPRFSFDVSANSGQWLCGWAEKFIGKKELCHSNETLHALNSTFPDTNCIVSFQINLHWILSKSGLWKVEETFCEWPGNLVKIVVFHHDNAPVHKSVVAMADVHDCDLKLVYHPPHSPDLAPSENSSVP